MARKHKFVCTVEQHPGEPPEKCYHRHLPQKENPLAVKKSHAHNPKTDMVVWLIRI